MAQRLLLAGGPGPLGEFQAEQVLGRRGGARATGPRCTAEMTCIRGETGVFSGKESVDDMDAVVVGDVIRTGSERTVW